MINELLELYVTDNNIKPETERAYRYVLADFERFVGRTLKPEDWNRQTVNGYLKHSEDRGLSAYTVNSRRTSLLVFWSYASGEGLVQNPVPPKRKIRRIRRPPHANRYVTPEQLQTILAKLSSCKRYIRGGKCPEGVFWDAWIRVAWDSGLRRSDMLALPWQPLLDGGGIYRVTQIKTGRLVVIRLSESTLNSLRRLHRYDNTATAFPCYWIPRKMSARFAALTKKLGLRMTMTTLRKSSATNVERARPGTAWRHLGHSSPETTNRWYLDLEKAYEHIPRPEELNK